LEPCERESESREREMVQQRGVVLTNWNPGGEREMVQQKGVVLTNWNPGGERERERW
jgi:hypothetical protein